MEGERVSERPEEPEDGTATHYLNRTYYKHDGCGWLFYNGMNWLYSGLDDHDFGQLEELN